MSYNRAETSLNQVGKVNPLHPQQSGVHHAASSDAQMLSLIQRVGRLKTALEEMTDLRDALQAHLDLMREERDLWQRKAERLWIDSSLPRVRRPPR